MAYTSAQSAYQAYEQRYVAANPRSKALYDEATASLPGGNTRSVLYYAPFPLSVSSASGSELRSADGKVYTDFLNEYTAGLYGHSHTLILSSISDALKAGLSFGSQHAAEARLAAQIKLRFPSIDLLRFTNSGTEATLMAIAAAKAYTHKKKILVFAGAYHGGAFSFKDGVSSAVNASHEWLVAEYNNLDSAREVLQGSQNGADLAAIILEPMIGSGGGIPAEWSFLEGLRELANGHGAVLIYDEVMTSRMHAGGGIQSQLPGEMRPDLTTLGKYIGGGMSFGAFGGKRAIMELFDPRRPNPLAHAGTFNNNVLTMAAGTVGLEQIFTASRAEKLHASGERLRTMLHKVSDGTCMKVTGYGSIMCFHFTGTPLNEIKSPKDLVDVDPALGGLFHLFLLERGFYIARRGFLSLSLSLSEDQLQNFSSAMEDFVRAFRPLLVVRAKSKL